MTPLDSAAAPVGSASAARAGFAAALIEGLSAEEKSIPCRFLYDRRGSHLFERICAQPEYYLTRIETEILSACASEIADKAGPGACLIELGSGASIKTRLLLQAMEALSCYIPIDVSEACLEAAAAAVRRDYRGLEVTPVCADYAADLPLPEVDARRVAFFPGSTIGNLETGEATALMGRWRQQLGADGLMVLGADLKKGAAALEAAYNDAAGVTEAFIKNVMIRANAELGAGFNPAAFAYEARYDPDKGCVEMHLRSRVGQTVCIGNHAFRIAAGEAILIERSHKYASGEIEALSEASGFAVEAFYTDADACFSVSVWRAARH